MTVSSKRSLNLVTREIINVDKLSNILIVAGTLLVLADWRLFRVPNFFRPLHWGIPATFVVAAFLLLEAGRASEFLPRLTASLGDWSYSIYLNHIIIIHAVGKFLITAPIFGIVGLDYAIFVISVVVLSGMLGFLTYKMIEHPLAVWRPNRHVAHDRLNKAN